jgi:hypothetical protein
MMARWCYFVLCAVISPLAWAVDLPFGGDVLLGLSRQADTVVVAGSASRVDVEKPSSRDVFKTSYTIFAISVDRVIRGKHTSGEKIRIAFPAISSPATPNELNGKTIFLMRPSAETVKNGLPALRDDVYIVVSGRLGAIATSSHPERVEAIRVYVESSSGAKESGALLKWTAQYIRSDDSFLRRSAVSSLYANRLNPGAVEQLKLLLQTGKVSIADKRLAVAALAGSRDATATELVARIAENASIDKVLREDAAQLTVALPLGETKLQAWSKGKDQLLAPFASDLLKNSEAFKRGSRRSLYDQGMEKKSGSAN